VLSIQLPFTLIPLLILCRKKKIMGRFRSKMLEFVLAIGISAAIIMLNIYLLYTFVCKGGA
jgi:manganese transport protein